MRRRCGLTKLRDNCFRAHFAGCDGNEPAFHVKTCEQADLEVVAPLVRHEDPRQCRVQKLKLLTIVLNWNYGTVYQQCDAKTKYVCSLNGLSGFDKICQSLIKITIGLRYGY